MVTRFALLLSVVGFALAVEPPCTAWSQCGASEQPEQLHMLAETEVEDVLDVDAALAAANLLQMRVHQQAEKVASTSSSASPTKYPNIEMAASGYNVYYSDPSPVYDESSLPNKDPGLVKPLFTIAYDQGRTTVDGRHLVPDGFDATVDMGCSSAFTSKTIRDMYELQEQKSSENGITARVEAGVKFPGVGSKKPGAMQKLAAKSPIAVKAFASAGGKMSYAKKKRTGQDEFRNAKLVRSSAKCASYVVGLSFNSPPKTHPEFKGALQKANSRQAYWKLFDDYGTHFMHTVKMGSRSSIMNYMSETKYSTMEGVANGLKIGVDTAAGATAFVKLPIKGVQLKNKQKLLKAKKTLLAPKEQTAVQAFEDAIEKTEISSVGAVFSPLVQSEDEWQDATRQTPVPIQFDTRDICLHPEVGAQGKATACEEALNSYCDGHLKPQGGDCSVPADRECTVDLDCNNDFVCRSHKCIAVPKCQVKICDDYSPNCGSSFIFPSIDFVKAPTGRQFQLGFSGWSDKIYSIQMSDGCLKVLAYDDADWTEETNNRMYWNVESVKGVAAGGYNFFNLNDDLQEDTAKIHVWAKPPPSEEEIAARLRGGARWLDMTGFKASQSSTLSDSYASRAIDGNTDANWGGRSCTHTTGYGWWQVDLGSVYKIEKVKVVNRADCCSDRLNGFKVYVDRVKCADGPSRAPGGDIELDCKATGSKVMIEESNSKFSLCEVQVKAEIEGGWPSIFTATQSSTSGGEIAFSEQGGVVNFARTSGPVSAQRAVPLVGSEAETFVASNITAAFALDAIIDADGTAEVSVSSAEGTRQSLKTPMNIGKGFYGYNHYFGAPLSAANAGTDPGFVPRRLFKVSFKDGNKAVFKDFTSVTVPAGTSSTPARAPAAASAPAPSSASVEYKNLGYGKCLLSSTGKEPTKAKWTGSGDEASLKKQCSENPACQAYSASMHGGGLLWLEGPVKGGGDSWGGAYCMAKVTESGVTPAPVATSSASVEYKNLGYGKCLLSSTGKEPTRAKWTGSGDEASLKKQCSENPACQAYSASMYGGGLLWLEGPLKGGGDSWGGCYCMVKVASLLQSTSSSKFADFYGGEPPLSYGTARAQDTLHVPDGYKVTMAKRTACESHSKTKTVKSGYDFEHHSHISTNPSGTKLQIGPVSFGFSHEQDNFAKQNAKNKKMMVASDAECISYVLEMKDAATPPEPDPTFDSIASQADTAEEYYTLFDMYGLEYPTRVLFGARYGMTQYITEESFSKKETSSEKWNVNVEAALSAKKMLKLPLPPGTDVQAVAGVTHSEGSSSSESSSSVNNFESKTRFSVGRGLPADGDVDAWIKDVEAEPMPIRFELTSICDHPSFTGKAAECQKYVETYCEEHLAPTKVGSPCTPAVQEECLWDVDCGEKHSCVKGKCEKSPDCTVMQFQSCDCNDGPGWPIVYGPKWRPTAQFDGFVFPVEGNNPMGFCCAKMTGGCEEVMFVDADSGQRNFDRSNSDTLIVQNRYSNGPTRANLNNDLRNDIWAIRALPKARWLDIDEAQLTCDKAGYQCLDGKNLWKCEKVGAKPVIAEWCTDGCTTPAVAEKALGREPQDFCSVKCWAEGEGWNGVGEYCLGDTKSHDGFYGNIYGCGYPGEYALYVRHFCGTKGCTVAPRGVDDECCQGSEPFGYGPRQIENSRGHDRCPNTKAMATSALNR